MSSGVFCQTQTPRQTVNRPGEFGDSGLFSAGDHPAPGRAPAPRTRPRSPGAALASQSPQHFLSRSSGPAEAGEVPETGAPVVLIYTGSSASEREVLAWRPAGVSAKGAYLVAVLLVGRANRSCQPFCEPSTTWIGPPHATSSQSSCRQWPHVAPTRPSQRLVDCP